MPPSSSSSASRPLRPVLAALTAVASLALVGACANGAGGADAPAQSAAPAPSNPLDAYWARTGTLGDPDRDRYELEQSLVERCMTEQGFDYAPVPYRPASVEVLPGYGTLPWAREFGYGVSTHVEAIDAAVGVPGPDPNTAAVGRLSEAESTAWSIAREGAGAQAEGGWQVRGCEGEAEHQVAAAALPWDDPDRVALLEAYAAAPLDLAASPEGAEAVAAWAACATAAGLEAATPAAARQLVVDAQASGMPRDELQHLEVEVAVADLTCRESSGFTAVERRLQDAHDQAFVDAHVAELDALVERWGDAG
ncbi:hypothetical protein [Cellulomonas fimi]|uniref:Lipoprotein n=1 Tax=Cellulomonas fimi (strain ATCC 484 / DSM 20113 / JCM 1341 / CCUG 24087 / LMG 16345 / NBRC 15513 / NCIMB 8980 / NCTC 7547 / NRS-133) TaxID=590998 RepID=F4H363_CELFA|nr:hypothetical protein [Cellulomonas fimi]AEE45284.1 hypothetical protein Celf_1149 [Cellulomonas fimi ATCC 484]NNH08029.1 hypothetical protein [Cellulomonas fimi]VEH28808.1 Uncharacterised protein [Cellulomonas fimi]